MGGTDAFWLTPRLKPTLDADLGCSSSFSIHDWIRLNLLEDRSVEKVFLPTAVVQELAGP